MLEGGIRESDWICQRGHFQWFAGLRPRWFIRVYTTAVITSDTRFRAWIESCASVLYSGNLDQAAPDLRDIASQANVTLTILVRIILLLLLLLIINKFRSLRILIFVRRYSYDIVLSKRQSILLLLLLLLLLLFHYYYSLFSSVLEGFMRFVSSTRLVSIFVNCTLIYYIRDNIN